MPGKLPAGRKTAARKQTDLQIVSAENTSLFGQKNFERYNPDALAARKGGLAIYTKMLMDEQVKAVADFKRAATLGNGWSFDFTDDVDLPTEERTNRINVMNAMLRQFRGSFVDAMGAILRGTAYGYSLTEKVLHGFEHEGKTYRGVAALLPRDVSTFKFYTDEYGVLEKFVQTIGARETPMPYERFIHFVRAPEVDAYYGEADLKAAYRAWFLKDTKLKFWAQYLERFAGGFASVNLNDSGVMPGTPDYTALQNFLANMRSTSGVILPRGVTLEMHNAVQTSAYKDAIEFHDLAIAKALLIPNLLGLSNTGTTGAYAQSQTQLEVFFITLAADIRRLEQVLNDQLFTQLGEENWDDGIFPRFKLRTTSGEQIRWIVTTWQGLVGANVVVPTEEDENHLRRLLEMPERTEEDTPLVTPQQEREEAQLKEQNKLARDGQEHQVNHDMQRLRLDEKTAANDADIKKKQLNKASFTDEPLKVEDIVRDEIQRLTVETHEVYFGVQNAMLFSSLKDLQPGAIICDEEAIPVTTDLMAAMHRRGMHPDESVGLTVRNCIFTDEIPPGTKLKIVSVTPQAAMLNVIAEPVHA